MLSYAERVERAAELLISDGPACVELLEVHFAEWLGVEPDRVVAVSSGTAALQACLLASGVESGDGVVLPALTFTATALAVERIGATPVFVDVDPETWTIDAHEVRHAVFCDSGIAAILAVDLHGVPADFDRLRRGIHLIEDAAGAYGSTYHGRPAGTLAGAAAFSLSDTKLLGAGEGGLAVFASRGAARIARELRRYGEGEPVLEIRASTRIGDNWKLAPFSAALALVTLENDLDARIARQRVAVTRLTRAIGYDLSNFPSGAVFSKLRLSVPDGRRYEIEDALEEAAIPYTKLDVLPPPFQPAFGGTGVIDDRFPVAARAISNSIVVGNHDAPLWTWETELLDSAAAVLAAALRERVPA